MTHRRWNPQSLDGYFFKKADTRRCVTSESGHPKHCRANMLSTLARRIYTTVEKTSLSKNDLNN